MSLAPQALALDRMCHDLAVDLGSAMEAVDQLDKADLPPGLRQQVVKLTSAMSALASDIDRVVLALRQQDTVPETAMDETRFLRLLEIAGPQDSVELVARLHLDLKTVRSGLFSALDQRIPDWEEVRAQTHVLIALAGAVGADALQHLAEAMNAAAHRRDLQEASDLRNDTARQLDLLIAYIARRDMTEPG